jgi:DnaK suppressor protein
MEQYNDGNNTDPTDSGTRTGEMLNQLAISAHVNRKPEAPLIIDGLRCCVYCEEIIDADRLAYLPHAVRCVSCQQDHEKRARGYAK